MKRRVTEYWLYKHRYVLSYTLSIVLIILGLIAAALFVPGGIRTAEMESVVSSAALTFDEFDPSSVINLPFHLLQRGSIELLGVSEFSIKLPSIILGLLTAIGMFLLIKEWFRQNVAIITVLMTATMTGFLFIAQDGTPQIFAVAVAIWLLVSGTYVSRQKKPQLLWKIAFGVLLALNMYIPLGVYLNLALLSTIIFHPHIRFLTKRLNPNRVVVASLLALVFLAPLLYSLTSQPSLGLQLLGIPEQKPDIITQATSLGKAFVWQQGSTNGIFHPIFSLGPLLIMIIGFLKFLQVKYTARSYIIWLWGLVLLPLLILNPDMAATALPLAMLMLAMGMNTLIAEWYKLFPYNPYARVLGLIPLSVIVIGIVTSAGSRYALNYYYNPEVVNNFSTDTKLLKETLKVAKADEETPVKVVVSKKNLAYYRLVAKHDKRFEVTTASPAANDMPYILSHEAFKSLRANDVIPSHITVNSRSQDSDRFYLYTSDNK